MNRKVCQLLLLVPLAAMAATTPGPAPVALGTDGRLQYQPDDFGNTIPDFSLAGYRNGGVALPEAPVAERLSPVADSTCCSSAVTPATAATTT